MLKPAESSSSHLSPAQRKRLIIRVSSLGDVILSTAALSTSSSLEWINDWVVGEEFALIVRGHPRIRKVWALKRKSGLGPWFRLCRQLWDERYEEVIDLHSSVRSILARGLFWIWGRTSYRGVTGSPRWVTFSKDRLRLVGYFVLKGLWPRAWRPSLVTERSAQAAGGTGQEKPDLRHLLADESSGPQAYEKFVSEIREKRAVLSGANNRATSQAEGEPAPWLCVMPSSHWKGKRWSVKGYFEALKKLQAEFGWIPVIMGQEKDEESVELVQALSSSDLVFVSGIGKWTLAQSARIISGAIGYIGSDTGLAHLSEALGVPATVIFGPTAWDLGFGPWREKSRGVEASLWCRPCSKDGQACFRIKDRYKCLKLVTPDMVVRALEEAFSEGMRGSRARGR